MRRRAMRSGVCSTFVLLAALAAVPAHGQTVLGFFEGLLSGGNAASGSVTLTGWALATSPVRRVTIQVDGVDVGFTQYGLARPDVEADHPGFPDSEFGGFGYNLNTADFPNGPHTLSAKVLTTAGSTVILAGTRQIFFNNNTHILKPFGDFSRPQRHAELRGTCDLTKEDPIRRYSVITGWALDLGVEIGDTGVSYVELLLDGAIIASTRLGDPNPLDNEYEVDGVGVCHYSNFRGGLSNCFGFPRLDIERLYPFALDAPRSGFRFVIDVGKLVARDLWPQGQHVIKARVGDISGQFADVAELPVNFLCIENIDNEAGFGEIESPHGGHPFAGVITLKGWVLDAEGVQQVRLFIDGEPIGVANYGVGSRPLVATEFLGYPDTAAPAWSLLFDTTTLTEGSHQLEAFVDDLHGFSTLFAEATFFVDNVNPD